MSLAVKVLRTEKTGISHRPTQTDTDICPAGLLGQKQSSLREGNKLTEKINEITYKINDAVYTDLHGQRINCRKKAQKAQK